jgi:hypothetical protein
MREVECGEMVMIRVSVTPGARFDHAYYRLINLTADAGLAAARRLDAGAVSAREVNYGRDS